MNHYRRDDCNPKCSFNEVISDLIPLKGIGTLCNWIIIVAVDAIVLKHLVMSIQNNELIQNVFDTYKKLITSNEDT